ncbi:MAG: insulinase family protein [Acholeplasmatales bacterium]|nr:insulinase family protein [Acholeplasmatales bacterium]
MNFVLKNNKYIEEIESDVYIYEHQKTKAQICFIKNKDYNRAFNISFKTLPFDDSGVFHILEHSIFCGSEKYPVKDPFIKMSQSSLASYLNAATTKSYTSFPVASTNLDDYHNLVDVYLDSVFHPNFFKNKEIFLQEGWHYELDNLDGELKYNGIVYNEMVGAYNDYETLLGKEINKNLFPDTYYSYDSGGNPESIPNLSYEKFLDTYKRCYHPSNACILIYGDLDIEDELNRLDKYLSMFDYKEYKYDIKHVSFDKTKHVTTYYQSNELRDSTYLTYSFLFDMEYQPLLSGALKLLFRYLFNSNDSHFKNKLLELNIGNDIYSDLDLNYDYPNVSIVLPGSNPENEEAFVNLIDSELKRLVKEGVDKEVLKNLIIPIEFSEREEYFSKSYPKGLKIGNSFISKMLCGIDPIDNYFYNIYYDDIKVLIDSNYFEEIIEEYLVKNKNRLILKCVPKLDFKHKSDERVALRLKEIKKSKSKEELLDIIKMNQALLDYQNEEDKPEDLAKLPKLDLKQIPLELVPFDFGVRKEKYDVLYSNTDVNGIVYFDLHFDITKIGFKYVKNISLFTEYVFSLATKYKDRNEVSRFIRTYFGQVYLSYEKVKTNDNETKSYLVVSASTLRENFDTALAFIKEALFETDFSKKNIKEFIALYYSDLNSFIVGNAYSLAKIRCASYVDELGKYDELSYGLSMVNYLKDISNNLDKYYDKIIKDFEFIKKLFSKKNFFLSLMCSNDYYSDIISKVDLFYDSLEDELNYPKSNFKPNLKQEALIMDSNVNFLVKMNKYNKPFDAHYYLLSSFAETAYLWNQVRVQGGAYGAYADINNEYVILSSYRDPNLGLTNKVFNDIYKNIKSIKLDKDELNDLKFSVFASTEKPVHAKDRMVSNIMYYLKGITPEERLNNRYKLVNATLEDFNKTIDILKGFDNNKPICAVCSMDAYMKNQKLFKHKTKLLR